MPVDRRTPEALPLRDLFHEQWSRLLHMIERWEDQRAAEKAEEQEISIAVDEVVEHTDARIRAIGSYKKQLRAGVRGLVEHISELADRLPPALPVSQHNFLDDPILNSMFVDPREMQQTFSRSRALQEFFARHDLEGVDEAYLLLFLGKRERTVLGMAQKEDKILRDVRQTTVDFYGHQVVAPSLTEAEARSSLKSILFESVVATIRSELKCMHPDHAGYVTEVRNMNPETCLEKLLDAISNPKKLIHMREDVLRISRLGILLPEDAACEANRVRLEEVEVGDNPYRVVLIARYPKQELLPLDAPTLQFPDY